MSKSVLIRPMSNSSTGILGVYHKPRNASPWIAKFGKKHIGAFRSKEDANYARLHYELHHVGVVEGRWQDFIDAGFSEEVLEKYKTGPFFWR